MNKNNAFCHNLWLLGGLLFLLSSVFASCSNDDELVNYTLENIKEVSVKSMRDFITQIDDNHLSTRSVMAHNNQVLYDMPVLQFKDVAAYEKTICELKVMTIDEQSAYFKKIGFDGACQLYNNADSELDTIFDIDDQPTFEAALSSYKEKYAGVFAFNEADEYDASPYLQFTDDNLALVGNAAGYVVVGDKLVEAKLMKPTFDELPEVESLPQTRAVPGPIQPGFKGFKNASMTIKNGKYKSTMTLGRIVNGNSFCVEFVTKKKQFLWNKKVNDVYYSCELAMSSTKFNHSNIVTCPRGSRWSILNLPIEYVGNVFNAKITNFKCSKGNTVGNTTFTNVNVI